MSETDTLIKEVMTLNDTVPDSNYTIFNQTRPLSLSSQDSYWMAFGFTMTSCFCIIVLTLLCIIQQQNHKIKRLRTSCNLHMSVSSTCTSNQSINAIVHSKLPYLSPMPMKSLSDTCLSSSARENAAFTL